MRGIKSLKYTDSGFLISDEMASSLTMIDRPGSSGLEEMSHRYNYKDNYTDGKDVRFYSENITSLYNNFIRNRSIVNDFDFMTSVLGVVKLNGFFRPLTTTSGYKYKKNSIREIFIRDNDLIANNDLDRTIDITTCLRTTRREELTNRPKSNNGAVTNLHKEVFTNSSSEIESLVLWVSNHGIEDLLISCYIMFGLVEGKINSRNTIRSTNKTTNRDIHRR